MHLRPEWIEARRRYEAGENMQDGRGIRRVAADASRVGTEGWGNAPDSQRSTGIALQNASVKRRNAR